MRLLSTALGAFALVTIQGCWALEAIGGSCLQQQLVVTWPATITRGSTVTTPLLTTTLTPSNLDQAQFDRLRQALISGGTTGTFNVMWGVPAFDVNGGFIAFMHAAPLALGETQQVGIAFQGGGWGAQPVGAGFPPQISLRADNFTATSATGSITAIRTTPLALRIDVTTTNAQGETIRVAGDAGFAYQEVMAICN